MSHEAMGGLINHALHMINAQLIRFRDFYVCQLAEPRPVLL